MKKILLVVAFAAFAVSASAQRAESRMFSFRKAEQPITFGIRAGVNFSGIADNNDEFDKTKTGFNVGLNMDLPIFQSFYVQTGLYFTTKGAKYESDKNKNYWYKDQINPMYLELPIYASWRLDVSEYTQLQVNIGPYFAVGVGGKYKWSEGGDSWDYEDSGKESLFGKKSELEYPMRRGDVGLGLGAGITVHKIYLGFTYSFGFNNLLRNSDGYKDASNDKFRNRNFTIQVGFNF